MSLKNSGYAIRETLCLMCAVCGLFFVSGTFVMNVLMVVCHVQFLYMSATNMRYVWCTGKHRCRWCSIHACSLLSALILVRTRKWRMCFATDYEYGRLSVFGIYNERLLRRNRCNEACKRAAKVVRKRRESHCASSAKLALHDRYLVQYGRCSMAFAAFSSDFHVLFILQSHLLS